MTGKILVDAIAMQEAGLLVRRYGTAGPEIILLHGGPGAPGEMAPIGRELADAFRLTEPFQRSSGAEPLTVARHIADLHEVIVSAGDDRKPVLLGFSWGAMLALAYAAAHPSSAGPLILVGCGSFDEVARTKFRETLSARMTTAVRDAADRASLLTTEDERVLANAVALMPLYVFDAAAWRLEVERVDARAYRESWNDMLRLQANGVYPASFAAIRTPVLMLHGDFDPHPGSLIRASLQQFLPRLEYRELSRCGHYPWLEKNAAAEFYASIREWLRRHANNT